MECFRELNKQYYTDRFRPYINDMYSVIERRYSQRSSNPYKGLERPLGLEEVEAPRMLDSR